MKAYLAGAIEYAPDKGKAWRDDMADFLASELQHDCYHPLREEDRYLIPHESKNFRSYKTTNLPEFQRIVRKLIRGDLQSLATDTDYIICLWDRYAERGGGTYGELTFAFYQGIPVYMVSRLPIAEITGWILGCATEIFTDFEELKRFLKRKYQ